MSFVAQLALVVSGVLVARMLGVGDRGRLALLVLFSAIVTQVGSLGMPLAVTYWVAREPRNASRLLKGLRVFVWRQIPLIIAVQAAILFVALDGTPGYERISGVISLASTPALVVGGYGLAILQGQRRFTAWNVCRLIFPLGYAIAAAALYIAGVHDLIVVVAVWAGLAWLAAGAAFWAAVSRRVPIGSAREDTPMPAQGAMLRFGLKALLGSLSPLQSFNLDQAVVGLFISPFALGIYVVAVAFTNLPFFIAQSVGAVAFPNIAASRDPERLRRNIVLSALAVLVPAGMLAGVLELILPWLVPLLFGAAFMPSVAVARILLIYAVLVALRRVLGDCARGAGWPGLSTMDEVAALLCMIPTILLLLGHGVRGVAVAMVISAAVGLVVIVVGLIAVTRGPDSRWWSLVRRPVGL